MTLITPTIPRAYATVTGREAIYTAPDGHREHVSDAADIRKAVLRRAADDARRSGAALELVTRGDQGDLRLLVDHDGTLTPIGRNDPLAEQMTESRDQATVLSELPEIATAEVADSESPAVPKSRATGRGNAGVPDHGAAAGKPVAALPSRRDAHLPSGATSVAPAVERTSFITATAPLVQPRGWRGVLARLGIRLSPSAYDVARAEWVEAVSRQWAGCRTIAVVNGKGGVGKTMTSAMLAAVYARHGGGNVLAWDNNDTRGTLGWRTEAGLYDTTLRDLLPAAGDLLSPTASVSDITRFVHHQSIDRYDVLRSNPELLATDQRLDRSQFDLLMQVAARYYRLVVFDSGNDESADRWLRMVDSSRQLVIPTLATPESAESAALLLEALRDRDEESAALAASAVVVVTQAEPGGTGRVLSIADGFRELVRAVETVPFDRGLKGGPLRLDDLRPTTRDAWLRVAAAATQNL